MQASLSLIHCPLTTVDVLGGDECRVLCRGAARAGRRGNETALPAGPVAKPTDGQHERKDGAQHCVDIHNLKDELNHLKRIIGNAIALPGSFDDEL
jgi:hypothetical protein